MNTEFSAALLKYLDACVADYKAWAESGSEDYQDEASVRIRAEMFESYKETLRFEIGKKYIKVIKDKSVHSFIVLEDTNKFIKGDILMAASWKAPATNFARGNIFGAYKVRWCGAG